MTYTDNHLGFDDAGDLVPITGPAEQDHHPDDHQRQRLETIVRLVQWLGATGSAVDVGRRLIVLQWLLRPAGSQRELAQRLGVSESAISQRLTKLREELTKLS